MYKIKTYAKEITNPITGAITEEYHIVVCDDLCPEGEDIVVSVDVYKEVRRSEWNNVKQNASYRKHITNSSELKGCEAYEEYQEAVALSRSTEDAFFAAERARILEEAVKQLTPEDKRLYDAVIYQGYSCTDYAKVCGVSQQAVNKRKHKIMKKLSEVLRASGLF